MLCPQCKNEMIVLAEVINPKSNGWIFVEAVCKNCIVGYEGSLVGMHLDKVKDLIEENK